MIQPQNISRQSKKVKSKKKRLSVFLVAEWNVKYSSRQDNKLSWITDVCGRQRKWIQTFPIFQENETVSVNSLLLLKSELGLAHKVARAFK